MTLQQHSSPDLPLWIALNSIPGLGMGTFKKLLSAFGSVTGIFEAEPAALHKLNIKDSIKTAILNGPDLEFSHNEIALAAQHNIRIIPLHSDEYPINLKDSPYACPLLYVKGALIPEDTYALAMVGTRESTPYGQQAAETIVSQMATEGITIVSGLALGIDRICHRKCINLKHRTLAVLGQGLLDISESQTLRYIDKIIENGAVISQFPLRYPGSKTTFPIRNLTISGLSKATLVVESKLKGGALITARACLDEGKDVLAIPGSIFSDTSNGCNELIKNGAHPIYDPKQISQIITANPFQSHRKKPEIIPLQPRPELTPAESELLSHMPADKIHIDRLSEQSALPASQVLAILTTLELKSCVATSAGMTYLKLV